MPAPGWQEFLPLLIVFVIEGIIPAAVVAWVSIRRTGRISIAWVLFVLLFGWLGAFVWAISNRRTVASEEDEKRPKGPPVAEPG